MQLVVTVFTIQYCNCSVWNISKYKFYDHITIVHAVRLKFIQKINHDF